MRRFIRSYRTRRNIQQVSRAGEQLIHQLGQQAEALMQRLSEEFSQRLEAQATEYAQRITQGENSPSDTSNADTSNSFGAIGQLLNTGMRYLVSRPRTSHTTQESLRSQSANQQFRLSQSQTLVELQGVLARGNKNN